MGQVMSSFTVGMGQVMSNVLFPYDMTLRNEVKQFNVGFLRPETLVSHSLESPFSVFFAKSEWAFLCH